MSVRKVAHGGHNIIGKFPSLKMGRMVSFESTIERDYVHLLEYEAQVEQFAEQPLTIEYMVNGKARHYTPDFKVESSNGITLVECKPESRVEEEHNQHKFETAAEWCERRGWAFEVVTDAELRKGCYLSNVKALYRHAHRRVTNDTLTHARSLVSKTPFSLKVLAAQIDPAQTAKIEADLQCFVFHHALYMDIANDPLTCDSLVYWTGNAS